MKFLGVILILALILAIIYIAMVWAQAKIQTRKISRAAWRVSPKTLPSGERQIWLNCRGETPFLQWDEKDNLSRDSIERQQKFDMAMLDAEAQVSEFNRLRRQQLRELKA